MLKLENVSPQEMPEVVRIASELYQQDQEKEGEAQERQSTLAAAEEVGLPAEYLHRAAEEMHSRRVEQVQRKRRTRNGLIAAAGIVAVFGIASFGVSKTTQTSETSVTPPTPMAYEVPLTEGITPQISAGTQAAVNVKAGAIQIQVEKFVPNSGGTYFVNADTYKLPPSLAGYETIRFRVRGSGLNQVRLYLENGPTERWRSRAVPATATEQEVTLSLRDFEYLTRPSADAEFRRQTYQPPDRVERLSFKVGDFVNDVNATGSVTIDSVKLE